MSVAQHSEAPPDSAHTDAMTTPLYHNRWLWLFFGLLAGVGIAYLLHPAIDAMRIRYRIADLQGQVNLQQAENTGLEEEIEKIATALNGDPCEIYDPSEGK